MIIHTAHSHHHNSHPGNSQEKIKKPICVQRRDEFAGINLPDLKKVTRILALNGPVQPLPRSASFLDKFDNFAMGAYQRILNCVSFITIPFTGVSFAGSALFLLAGNINQARAFATCGVVMGICSAIIVGTAHMVRRYRERGATRRDSPRAQQV